MSESIHFAGQIVVTAMPLITALFSFLLVGFLGNFLVQRWQQGNWLEQQRIIRAEKQLEELKRVSDDLMKLGDARSYKTRRILLNLGSLKPDELDRSEFLSEYRSAVGAWNDSFNSLCARLTLYGNSYLTSRLENDIQARFYKISERLDNLVRTRKLGGPIPPAMKNKLIEELNWVNGRLTRFYAALLQSLLSKQKEAYVGREVKFTPRTIDQFSTWYLLKALFQAKHPPMAVFGPPTDPL